MNINSLLNSPLPSSSPPLPPPSSFSPPLTPAYTLQASSVASTPAPQTPNTPSSRLSQKAKDMSTFSKASVKGRNEYPPYEVTEKSPMLSRDERKDLLQQHDRFKIYPRADVHGLTIGDCPRTVPYSSAKRTFSEKTKKDTLEIYNYKFTVPTTGEEWTVMWDYTDGLVRITPFFKALGHQKTVPNKVIRLNPGLSELSHSITGGSISAQGYWMDFGCAYAVCQTFCWEIRWALTPIFGPAFVKDCLPPTHPNFKNFRIDPEVIRVANAKAEGRLRGITSRADTPDIMAGATTSAAGKTPCSVPAAPSPKMFRTRKPKQLTPTTEIDSPLQSDTDVDDFENRDDVHQVDSPMVSPKTTPEQSLRAWTPINGYTASPPAASSGRTILPCPLTPQPQPDSPWAPANKRDKGKKRRLSPLLSDPDYSSASASSTVTVSDGSSSGEESNNECSTPTPAQRSRSKRTKKYHAKDYNCAFTMVKLSGADVEAAKILLLANKDDEAFGEAQRRVMSE